MRGRFQKSTTLLWSIPVFVGTLVEILLLTSFIDVSMLNQHHELFFVIAPFSVIAPIGGWWAVYQCLRYEDKPAKFILVVVILPLGFTWYYFERYRLRRTNTVRQSAR